jgi:hypothetical protein
MDIVRITLKGYGYDIARAIINKKDYEVIKNSKYYEKSWSKNLYIKITNITNDIIEDFRDVGLIKGEMTIWVNGDEIINIPVSVIETFCDTDNDIVDLEGYQYPLNEEIVMTTIQELEGIFMDEIFITKDEFDFNNFKFVFKDIHDDKNNTIIKRIVSEVYYDTEIISFNTKDTDLRMSSVNFDIKDNKTHKNEKN